MMMKVSRLLLIVLLCAPTGKAFGDTATELVKTLEIFYMKPEMRSPADVIKVENGVAEISLWRDLPADPNAERIECLGYQWLLSGRGEKMGAGAREAFQKFPELQSISLQFVELDHKTKTTDGRGKLEKVVESKAFLKMSVDRASALALKLDSKTLKMELRKGLSSCLAIGRETIKIREVTL